MRRNKKKNQAAGEPRLVLVGNPNVGKSVIFGALTGRYATVSNYPGTTVGVSRGTARIGGANAIVIDSPGVNSLVPVSEDEKVTRDILLHEDIETVLQVLDAKNLRRGLLITVQLLEMGLPVVLDLNMYDEAGERGIKIDTDELEGVTGLKVIPTIATQGWNIDKLGGVFDLARRPQTGVKYPEAITRAIKDISALLPVARISPESIAVMLLSGDETISEWLEGSLKDTQVERIRELCGSVQSIYPEPVGYIINRARLRKVDALLKKVIEKKAKTGGRVSTIIGRYAMHPVWGVPFLLFVLFLMYEFVGVLGASLSVDFFERIIFGRFLNPWVTRVVEYPLPSGFFHDLLVGPYGIITMALTYSIAIVLPIVGFFFIFFSLLEDSGYLPRLALMADKLFKKLGLNGKAVLPMVLGLGCDTMATMTTRILETKKERVIVTLLLALGVPCSAQLGVILGMLGSVSLAATVVWGAAVLIIIFLVGYLASKIVPGETSDFIIEIPPVRLPMLSNVVLKTLVRVQWYLKEAVPLFVLGTLFLFLLDKSGALILAQRLASPVIVGILNLPVDATQAFIVGFLRRDYGAAGLLNLQRAGQLDHIQVVVSLVTITLFVPCIANLFMMIKERGLKTALGITIFVFPFAIFAGGVLNIILRALNLPL